MPVNMSMYGQHGGNYGNQNRMMVSQQHAQQQNTNMPAQNQHYNQMYRNPYPGPGPGYQGPRPEMASGQEMGYSDRGPSFQNPNYNQNQNQRSQYAVKQVQGSMSPNPVTVQQAHPHLRNRGQNPQEVANNILQMTSAYPTQHTVQVPLSKNRSAPYQVPPRSPHFSMPQNQMPDPPFQGQMTELPFQGQMAESQFQGQMGQQQDYQSNKNFVYPNSSPHMMQMNRMSPVSPSPGMMQSPHSHHSGQNMPTSSPHSSVHSPAPGSIRSPASDGSSARSPMLNAQSMTSPQGMNYQQMTSHSQQHHHGVPGNSPVPMNQQLQVNVPSNSSSHRTHSAYGEHMVSPNNQQFTHHSSTQFSPSSNPMNSPGRFSNISSPYTPGSKGSHHSPNQSFAATSSASQYLSNAGSSINARPQEKMGGSSPLRSLQKLCMLPERQVVDPKSVVNDSCVPSPKSSTYSKNSEPDAGWQDNSLADKGGVGEPASGSVQPCTNDSNCSPVQDSSAPGAIDEVDNGVEQSDAIKIKDKQEITQEKSEITDETASDSLTADANKAINVSNKTLSPEKANAEKVRNCEAPAEEVKRQPKKKMLLRAAQEDAYKQKQKSMPETDCSDNHVPEVKSKNENSKSEICSDINKRSVTVISEPAASENNVNESSSGKEPELCVAYENNPVTGDSSESIEEEKYEVLVTKDCTDADHKEEKINLESSNVTPSKTRGPSIGSLSDETSEFDLQDHIGCDDINNSHISDDSVTEKENIMDFDNTLCVENNKTAKINDIKSAIIVENGCKVKLPSSPHWKKSKLNDLQALQHDSNQTNVELECEEKVSVSVKRDIFKHKKKSRVVCRSKRIRKPVNCNMEVNGHDSDSEGAYHSNISDIDIVNGDGTVAVAKRTTSRLRKQPLKYKDTSFLQCDFIFADEEENEEFDYEPKKKCKKLLNHISDESNEDTKNSDCTDTKHKNGKIPFQKNGLSKTHQQTKGEKNVIVIKKRVVDSKPNSKAVIDKGAESHGAVEQENTCDTDSKEINNDTAAPLDSNDDNKGLCDNDSPPKSCDNKEAPLSKNNETKGDDKIEVNNLAKNVHKRSNANKYRSRVKNAKGTSSIKEKTSKPLPQHSSKSETETKTDKESIVGDTVDGVVSVKEEQAVIVDLDGVIKTDSYDDKNGFDSADVKKEERVKEFDEVTVDLTFSEDEMGNDSSELVNGSSLIKHEDEETKPVIKSKNRSRVRRNNKAVIKSDKQRAKLKGSKANQRSKKRKTKRKNNIYDNDSDYEAGPKAESFKSLKLNKTQDLVSKKKKHEKSLFKGPMIRVKGSKECPEKCDVLNQPFHEGDLKANKTKTVIQSSVEISHLPSDRSVFVPCAESEDTDSWVCVLCGKHSSYKFTGDLFGPYTLDIPMEGEKLFPSVKQSGTSRGSRSKSVESTSASGHSSRSSKGGQRSSKEANSWKEVWVHEYCALWADGVFLIGMKIYGLQEAAKIACKTVS